MIGKRSQIVAGMLAGALWAVGVLFLGRSISVPIGLIQPVLLGAAFPPGMFMLFVIARLAQRRFFDDQLIDGAPAPTGSPEGIDQRVLQNTLEQVVLALCVWPLAGFVLGSGVPLVLGSAFFVARLAFWIGYHRAPPLRAFGFAATFYPTVLTAIWTIAVLAT